MKIEAISAFDQNSNMLFFENFRDPEVLVTYTDGYRVPARKKFLGTDGNRVPGKVSLMPTPDTDLVGSKVSSWK